MDASDLILKLRAIIETNGDLPVCAEAEDIWSVKLVEDTAFDEGDSMRRYISLSPKLP